MQDELRFDANDDEEENDRRSRYFFLLALHNKERDDNERHFERACFLTSIHLLGLNKK